MNEISVYDPKAAQEAAEGQAEEEVRTCLGF